MNIALASLFTWQDEKNTLEPGYQTGTNKKCVFDAMARIGKPCALSDLMQATSLSSNQVQYALRHMKDHGIVDVKETPRGAGRIYQYFIAPKGGRITPLMTRIVALLKRAGKAMDSSEISLALDVSPKTIKTTISYAIKNSSELGFTRDWVDGRWLYKGV